MLDLLPIQKYNIGRGRNKEETMGVSARDLWKVLGVGKDFSNWIKGRIDKYGFIKNQDYIILKNTNEVPKNETLDDRQFRRASNIGVSSAPQNGGASNMGGLNKIEYILTLDTAKEIAMIGNNKKGKAVRKYFIECEKKLKRTSLPIESLQGLFDFMGVSRDIGWSLINDLGKDLASSETNDFDTLRIIRNNGSWILEKEIPNSQISGYISHKDRQEELELELKIYETKLELLKTSREMKK